jgi:hypothetical protein
MTSPSPSFTTANGFESGQEAAFFIEYGIEPIKKANSGELATGLE